MGRKTGDFIAGGKGNIRQIIDEIREAGKSINIFLEQPNNP